MAVIEIRKTERFAKWIDGLRDLRARDLIQVKIEQIALGLAGDVKPVVEEVSELRIDLAGFSSQLQGIRYVICRREL
jgi:putative addiction module killer protein